MIKLRPSTKKRKKGAQTSVGANNAVEQRKTSVDLEDATRLLREAVMHDPSTNHEPTIF